MVAGSIGGGGSGSDIIVARGRHLAQLGTGTHLAQRVAWARGTRDMKTTEP